MKIELELSEPYGRMVEEMEESEDINFDVEEKLTEVVENIIHNTYQDLKRRVILKEIAHKFMW